MNNSMFRIRRAFTLVELLVVISIIGMLLALILPAINAARDSARQTQSKNNLKEVALGMLAFHEAHEVFPQNASVYNGTYGGILTAWTVAIASFIEAPEENPNTWWFDSTESTNASIARACPLVLKLPWFPGSGVNPGQTDVAMVEGVETPQSLDITAYGSSGWSQWLQTGGGFTLPPTGIGRTPPYICHLENVKDSKSDTILIAPNTGPVEFSDLYNSDCWTDPGYGLVSGANVVERTSSPLAINDPNRQMIGIRNGVTLLGYADGSVRSFVIGDGQVFRLQCQIATGLPKPSN